MNPGPTQHATRALGAPEGWDREKHGDCSVLPIRDIAGRMESTWYPTPQERAEIMRGQPIVLSVWGTSHPPVSVNVLTADADQWCDVHEKFENREEWMACDDELHRLATGREK